MNVILLRPLSLRLELYSSLRMSVLVSFIIPVYNAEQYLRRCMDSVLGQDYEDFEVLLVDDGSLDGSGRMCDEYAAKDDRVRVVHQENQGASIARLNGLKIARGEYVTFVDSDDWIDSQYVSTLFQMAAHYKVNVCACGVKQVKEGEENASDYAIQQPEVLEYEELMPRFFKYEFWGFPGKLYLRSALMQIPFPKATLSEDYLVMSKLFMQERKMAYIAVPLYFYEYHPSSLSHQKLSKRAFEEFDNVKAVYDLMKEQGPQYANMALANVVETCIKLHLMVLHSLDANSFLVEYSQIHTFLKQHFKEIMSCNSLQWKSKIVVASLLTCPKVVARFM